MDQLFNLNQDIIYFPLSFYLGQPYLNSFLQVIQPTKSFATFSLQIQNVNMPLTHGQMIQKHQFQQKSSLLKIMPDHNQRILCSQPSIKKNQQRCQVKKQKKGRNIFSNIFRSFLKFLNSKKFYEQYFEKFKQEMTKDQFILSIRQISKPFQNYVKKEQILKFLSQSTKNKQLSQFNIIIRKSLLFYIKSVHVMTIYNSKKININFRKLHLKQLRIFEQTVNQMFRYARNQPHNTIQQQDNN